MALPLVVTPGDPAGIGPEVAARALADLPDVNAVIAGDRAAMRPWLDRLGLPFEVVEPIGTEPIEVRALRWAVDACLEGRAAAMVTGPIHKAKLAAQGFTWPGHTGFLGHLCGVPEPVMAFVGGRVRVALVTVHLPLREVPDALTEEVVVHTVRVAAHALAGLGIEAPVVSVCGLNPHAGDEGLLGREEIDIIAPAVARCRALGIDARGPMSAEAAFLPTTPGDLIVAMYHDQGLVPLKALDFGRTVNWTLGLPIVRTSVDHGTAYDLVGTGRADPSSMREALKLAQHLTARRTRTPASA
ncbi:MAG: 4-hydroxythreonine-4-phosphate dehydrogenase PdxA [Alphaproteobacteria bacterium]|nr:4-hydroxythreonine-4-phosphate dehydrogenase PdxA [Alphaproteobacteria bacterium]